jgi:nucleoside-diphosphate-sugar epimerase
MRADKRLFCFGLGYSARVLAERLRGEGWSVAGTSRTPEGVAALAAAGLESLCFDRSHPLPAAARRLEEASHVLLSIPPGADGDPVLAAHRDDFIRLAEGGRLAWVGYLSTTGVYGDAGGGWVDETTAPRPAGPRQQRRLEAELAWLALGRAAGLPVHIFRLAGIYGPGRSAVDAVRAGTARRIDKPGHVFSRIHVADLAEVLRASMGKPDPGRIYNVCDDLPASAAEVVDYACRRLGVESPPMIPFKDAELSEMASSFYLDNKRVRNYRIKDELEITLKYPTFYLGIEQILRAERLVSD